MNKDVPDKYNWNPKTGWRKHRKCKKRALNQMNPINWEMHAHLYVQYMFCKKYKNVDRSIYEYTK